MKHLTTVLLICLTSALLAQTKTHIFEGYHENANKDSTYIFIVERTDSNYLSIYIAQEYLDSAQAFENHKVHKKLWLVNGTRFIINQGDIKYIDYTWPLFSKNTTFSIAYNNGNTKTYPNMKYKSYWEDCNCLKEFLSDNYEENWVDFVGDYFQQ